MGIIPKFCFLFSLSIGILLYCTVNAMANPRFVLEHFIPISSQATVRESFGTLKKGLNLLGTIDIENNTIDGFTLSVRSENNGYLAAITPDSGEENIPYTLTLTKTNGFLGEGIIPIGALENISLPAETVLLDATTYQSSPTHVVYRIDINIAGDMNWLTMAGNYSDTLVFEFSDN